MTKISSKVKGRCWGFTYNNPSAEDFRILKSWKQRCEATDGMRFCMGQYEVGKKGTKHLQGYLELTSSWRKSKVIKLFKATQKKGHACDWYQRKGTQAQMMTYVSKRDSRITGEESFEWRYGEEAKSRCSEDLVSSVIAGCKLKDMALEFPKQYMQNCKGIKELREITQKPRAGQPNITVYWGNTRTGKSYMAHKNNPGAYWISWNKGGVWWWDNYDHTKCVIGDEFKMQIPLQKMLRFLDRYAFSVQYKGGTTEMNSEKIIIISNVDPMDWYNGEDMVVKEALVARLEEYAEVYEFTTRYVYDPEVDPIMILDRRFDNPNLGDDVNLDDE